MRACTNSMFLLCAHLVSLVSSFIFFYNEVFKEEWSPRSKMVDARVDGPEGRLPRCALALGAEDVRYPTHYSQT